VGGSHSVTSPFGLCVAQSIHLSSNESIYHWPLLLTWQEAAAKEFAELMAKAAAAAKEEEAAEKAAAQAALPTIAPEMQTPPQATPEGEEANAEVATGADGDKAEPQLGSEGARGSGWKGFKCDAC